MKEYTLKLIYELNYSLNPFLMIVLAKINGKRIKITFLIRLCYSKIISSVLINFLSNFEEKKMPRLLTKPK